MRIMSNTLSLSSCPILKLFSYSFVNFSLLFVRFVLIFTDLQCQSTDELHCKDTKKLKIKNEFVNVLIR